MQIVDALRQKIELGQLPPYTRLPSSRQLAQELHVNRITIVNAYAELEAEGLVKSHVGQGTFVAEVPAPGQKQTTPWRPPIQFDRSVHWRIAGRGATDLVKLVAKK
jgi:DNA-binding GntR family transcriptional regulator